MTVRKVPKEQKVDLIKEIIDLLQSHYKQNPRGAVEYLLVYFNAWDLTAIRDELLEAKTARIRAGIN